MPRFRRALPEEHPSGPVLGHKLAYPLLSADRRTAGFKGVWSSAQPVYQVRDTAVCFWNERHRPPHRRCGCGFYCFHSLDAARAMACEGQYRLTVILAVEVSGRFIRHEHGFRYSNQRVLAVQLNRCPCGRPANVLVDSGNGTTGWLQLQPSCVRCGASKELITPSAFGALLGDPTLVAPGDDAASGEPLDQIADSSPVSDREALSVLAAEVALLQARVDTLQAQLSRLTSPPPGDSPDR